MAIGCCCGRGGCFRACRWRRGSRPLLDEMLTPDKVAGELAYLDRAYTGGFERPYGWAWLLALHAEAQRHEADWAERWRRWPQAFADALQGLSAQAHLPDPHRHAFQHRLRDDPGARLGGDERRRRWPALIRARARRLLWRGPRLPGLGAGRRRFPLAGADRGAADAPDAAGGLPPPGSPPSCPISPARPAEPVHARLRLRPVATARSPISTGSISAAPGAGAAWRARSIPDSRRLRATRRTPISTPACRMSRAIIWASIGWRPSPCSRWKERLRLNDALSRARPDRSPASARRASASAVLERDGRGRAAGC